MKKSKRKVYCADAFDWFKKHSFRGSIITSLPDLDEVDMSEEDYLLWFCNAIQLCLRKTDVGLPTIFYQTDRKRNGRRISKACLIMNEALGSGHDIIWHKIVLRRDVGKVDLRRPGYSHLICIGDAGVTAGKATADVLPGGGTLYPNGMALSAATMALEFAHKYSPNVIDPFCGKGTVLALAESMGFKKIIGIDIDPKQVKEAKLVKLGSFNVQKTGNKTGRFFSK